VAVSRGAPGSGGELDGGARGVHGALTRAGQGVEQGRLPDVGSADEQNAQQVRQSRSC